MISPAPGCWAALSSHVREPGPGLSMKHYDKTMEIKKIFVSLQQISLHWNDDALEKKTLRVFLFSNPFSTVWLKYPCIKFKSFAFVKAEKRFIQFSQHCALHPFLYSRKTLRTFIFSDCYLSRQNSFSLSGLEWGDIWCTDQYFTAPLTLLHWEDHYTDCCFVILKSPITSLSWENKAPFPWDPEKMILLSRENKRK